MADPDWVGLATAAHCKYTVPGMAGVQVRNLTYTTRDGHSSNLDIYGPPNNDAIALIIHGGPIPPDLSSTPVHWGLFQSLARLLAASGITTAVFNHRFFSPELVLTAIQDIEDVIQQLNTKHLALWAFSGGGSLLAPLLRNPPQSLRCLVTYYAALDARTKEYSAENALTADAPPMLIVRAGLDMPQINDTIDRFIAAALQKNAPIEVMNHPTGQHGFDFRDDNQRTREILARTVEFIRTHL